MIDAIIAAEDEDFWSHPGVNPLASLRAAWANVQKSRYSQGASTLTMQVVRRLSQNEEKTMSRKIREMAMAITLDGYLGKEGVLQMYLDAPYLGQAGWSICGFEAASKHYWGKSAKELSLAEAATLAGILPAPARYGPDVAPKLAKLRRDRVLRRMELMGYDVDSARAEEVTVKLTIPETQYPSYMQATRAWLEASSAVVHRLWLGAQRLHRPRCRRAGATEFVLNDKVAYMERSLGQRTEEPLQAAGAMVDPYTGALVAVYGGRGATSTSFNRATQARRQAGSAFKPMVFALAFSRTDGDGMPLYSASDTVKNERRTFENTDGWRPRNVGGKYSKTISLASALAHELQHRHGFPARGAGRSASLGGLCRPRGLREALAA